MQKSFSICLQQKTPLPLLGNSYDCALVKQYTLENEETMIFLDNPAPSLPIIGTKGGMGKLEGKKEMKGEIGGDILEKYHVKERLDEIAPEGLIEEAKQELVPEKGYGDREFAMKATVMDYADKSPVIFLKVAFLLVYGMCAARFLRILRAIYYVDAGCLGMDMWDVAFGAAFPFFLWYVSSLHNEFNFTDGKIRRFKACILNLAAIAGEFVLILARFLVVPFFLGIPVNREITAGMILFLARFFLFLATLGSSLFFSVKLLGIVSQEEVKENILKVRIRHGHDFRKGRKFLYDMNFIKRLDNGQSVVIKEEDRFLHTDLDGTTGTGKTSSCITTAAADDMDQKRYNEQYLKKQMKKMLQKGEVRITEKFVDEDFSLACFKPTESGKKKFKKLEQKVKDAGITLMAPNASLADEIYGLAAARGFKVNRVDPTLDENGRHKPGFVGFNPLYISPKLSPLQRTIEIVNKARTFADVMQALYEMNGTKDAYFTSLNSNLTSSISILVMLTYPRMHGGRQPKLTDIQDVVNNFRNAAPYADELQRMINDDSMTDRERGFTKNTFRFILDLVKTDLCGSGADKISEQARGLRTQISDFLMNPLYKEILCSDKSVDMDNMLANGEITVVNYALVLGRADATAFGLFFALNFNNAVIRRPVNMRIPHFYYIDEFPVLLHPSLEQCFTLFRQYKVAMTIAIQTLDQMNRSESTKYLKGVLLGNCAHQIVFGRVSTAEMEYYEKLGGKRKETVEQVTVSETALSLEDTGMSFSVRGTPTDVANIEGSRMRSLAFQEVTVFTVNEGSVVEAFYGKVDFLKRSKRLKRKRYTVDWSAFYSPNMTKDPQGNQIGSSKSESAQAVFPTLNIAVHEGSAEMHEEGSAFGAGSIFISGKPEGEKDSRREDRKETEYFSL